MFVTVHSHSAISTARRDAATAEAAAHRLRVAASTTLTERVVVALDSRLRTWLVARCVLRSGPLLVPLSGARG